MDLLNTQHKLILFSLLLLLISTVINSYLWQPWMSNFLAYFIPYSSELLWSNSSDLASHFRLEIQIFVPILGISILLLSATSTIKKIEIALIPIVIYTAYAYLPWWIVAPLEPVFIELQDALPGIVCFSLLSYGTFFLIKEKSQTKKIVGIAEELNKFSELKEKGIIYEEEFNKKKEELLK